MIPKAPKHKRIKPKIGKKTGKESEFWERLRRGGCQVPGCGRSASIHHEPFRSQGGHHKSVVALCPFHHQDNKGGRHGMSLDRFNKTYGVDLLGLVEMNFRRYYRD